MSIENEIKKLNETITGLTNAVQAMAAIAGQIEPSPLPTTVGEVEDLVAHEEAEKIAETVAVAVSGADLTPITREALGQKLAGLAGKFGTAAQDGIKQIILETAGTQALSQVDVAHLPIINQKAEKFSEYLEAQARG
jgi:hypothetical protein